MTYTERVDGLQICDPTYLGQPPVDTPPSYDIVKWCTRSEPYPSYEIRDGNLCFVGMSEEFCYVVARLVWDRHEEAFQFESVGMRWIEDVEPTKAVIQMILDFCEEKGRELTKEDWDDE